jgi:phosphate/sulfate permease
VWVLLCKFSQAISTLKLSNYKLNTMNWLVLIPVGTGAVALIVFLVIRNIKDERKFEDQLKNDYRKPKNDKGDVEIDDVMK